MLTNLGWAAPRWREVKQSVPAAVEIFVIPPLNGVHVPDADQEFVALVLQWSFNCFLILFLSVCVGEIRVHGGGALNPPWLPFLQKGPGKEQILAFVAKSSRFQILMQTYFGYKTFQTTPCSAFCSLSSCLFFPEVEFKGIGYIHVWLLMDLIAQRQWQLWEQRSHWNPRRGLSSLLGNRDGTGASN